MDIYNIRASESVKEIVFDVLELQSNYAIDPQYLYTKDLDFVINRAEERVKYDLSQLIIRFIKTEFISETITPHVRATFFVPYVKDYIIEEKERRIKYLEDLEEYHKMLISKKNARIEYLELPFYKKLWVWMKNIME